MADLKLGYGCNRALPDDITAAWGARLIWPNDLVHDRQDMQGDPDAVVELANWLNQGVLKTALCRAARAGSDLRAESDLGRDRDALRGRARDREGEPAVLLRLPVRGRVAQVSSTLAPLFHAEQGGFRRSTEIAG